MKLPENPDLADLRAGDLVFTACGGRIEYAPWIAQVLVQGKRVFFCLPSCQREFEQNPRFSCLGPFLAENGE